MWLSALTPSRTTLLPPPTPLSTRSKSGQRIWEVSQNKTNKTYIKVSLIPKFRFSNYFRCYCCHYREACSIDLRMKEQHWITDYDTVIAPPMFYLDCHSRHDCIQQELLDPDNVFVKTGMFSCIQLSAKSHHIAYESKVSSRLVACLLIPSSGLAFFLGDWSSGLDPSLSSEPPPTVSISSVAFAADLRSRLSTCCFRNARILLQETSDRLPHSLTSGLNCVYKPQAFPFSSSGV